jgi:two-component system, NtrC family, sensor kinase
VNTRHISILMLTVEEAQHGVLRGLNSGADDYLSKSADTDVLLLRVRTLLRKANAQVALVGGQQTQFRRARLLVIDDSPTYLTWLTEEMARDGYQVEAASCGREGMKCLAEHPFDCVLVDLMMPEMDGIEVCRQISQTWRTIDNPIVVLMLTAHETKEDMTRGLSAGADDFVGKSSDMAVLKARIHVLLRRKFFQEENRRIVEELKNKELEAVKSRAEKEAAESRAGLAEKLAQTNRELEETNRTLKQTQAHLIHSEKMVSLGQLVAGIAHEINNPLAFVLNNVFVVRESLQRLAPAFGDSSDSLARLDTIRGRMNDVKEGAERVRDLVSKLRTFSRLDEGEFKTVDIHESIESVLMFLRHRMEHRIEVQRKYCDVVMLSCFAGELNQVLMNIVANAIDSIPGAGTIEIATRQENGFFSISVHDSGKGIPKEIQHRIFEPFFTTKPVGEGTGLGLAISYGIMKAHDGKIECVSEEGKGTKMTVSVPSGSEGEYRA